MAGSICYAYVTVVSRRDMIGIRERLSANQQALYAYTNHVLTGHNSENHAFVLIPILQPISLLCFMFMLASQVRAKLKALSEEK